ncbi:MAG: hypothetical protein HND51_23570 [Chloroflexi bacterium]|nr:hypothetical protein [Chloroflexota bacterium]
MKLSAPKQITWWVGVVIGVVALLMGLGVFSLGFISAFWLMAIGWVVLVLGTAMKGI